ncbi:hypothetical protein [Acinetobacter soli]|uniref:hypothetical protein n=1 Tax=Acinetobacter soli TaxID=487316 RepID=UPI000CE4CE04|nr:hypothetical protein [Acinetobacter soli]PPB86315.1 hypothetical protein AsoHEU7_10220 [Acinetobacter soli]WEI12325.1 hypothetical protein PX667_13250 [Acinetobacter soli]
MKYSTIFYFTLFKLILLIYIKFVWCKIIRLAVEGYKYSLGAYSPLRAFFMRKISMHSHVMAKLERDAFERTGNLVSLSSNPFQLCHPHLEVNGKAPIKTLGVHSS